MVDEFLNSKRYRHEIEVYGGKMSVLADQMERWFSSLWQGRRLAGSIAVITLCISSGLSFVAYHSPPAAKEPAKKE